MSMNRTNGIQLDETKEEQRKRVREIELRRSKQGESVVITVDRKNKILIKWFSQVVSSKIYVALRWPCVVREWRRSTKMRGHRLPARLARAKLNRLAARLRFDALTSHAPPHCWRSPGVFRAVLANTRDETKQNETRRSGSGGHSALNCYVFFIRQLHWQKCIACILYVHILWLKNILPKLVYFWYRI